MQGMGFERMLGGVCAPEGFLAAGVHCGIKEDGWPDLAIVYSELPTVAAGVFTSNELKAAPVSLSESRIASGKARAVIVTSGCANAMTGEKGRADALRMATAVEKGLGLSEGEVLVASTGMVGEYLPIEKVTNGVDQAISELSPGGNTDASKAIMTTDTYPKELAVEMEIGGEIVRIGAMAKGSGMVHPDLATVIVVITTDVSIGAEVMHDLLAKAVEWSFNRISVDGDQSTNDTAFMLANSAAFPDGYSMSREETELFFRALCWLTANLAMALVKDGEGASKLMRIVVNGARDDSEAVRVARAIANSNLVKCAIYGGIPMWGRVAAAAGSAGIEIDADRLDIYFGEHKVAEKGEPADYNEASVAEILDRDEVEITVDLGAGEGSTYFLTSDLTSEYVDINAGEEI